MPPLRLPSGFHRVATLRQMTTLACPTRRQIPVDLIRRLESELLLTQADVEPFYIHCAFMLTHSLLGLYRYALPPSDALQSCRCVHYRLLGADTQTLYTSVHCLW